MPMGATVAHFVRFYGAAAFDNGKIGWRWYQYLVKWMPNAEAAEMIGAAQATAAGAALGFDPEGGGKSALAQIRQEVVRER